MVSFGNKFAWREACNFELSRKICFLLLQDAREAVSLQPFSLLNLGADLFPIRFYPQETVFWVSALCKRPIIRHSMGSLGFCQMSLSPQGYESQAQVHWISIRTLKSKGWFSALPTSVGYSFSLACSIWVSLPSCWPTDAFGNNF